MTMKNIWTSSNFKEILPDCISIYSQSLLPELLNNATKEQYKCYGFHIGDSIMPIVKVFNRKPYFNMTALQYVIEHCWLQDGKTIARSMGGACDTELSKNMNVDKGIVSNIKLSVRAARAILYGSKSHMEISKEWKHLEKENWSDIDRIVSHSEMHRMSILEKQISKYIQRHLIITVFASALVDVASRCVKKRESKSKSPNAEYLLGAAADAPNIQQQNDFNELVYFFAKKKSGVTDFELEIETKFKHYVAKYGHRSVFEMEVAQPRLSEQPENLLSEIEAACAAGILGDPRRKKNKPDGLLSNSTKRPYIEKIWVFMARSLLSSREKSKYLVARKVSQMRMELLLIARSGKIPGLVLPEDIFTLERNEINRILDGALPDARVLISARKTYSQPPMPDSFQGREPNSGSTECIMKHSLGGVSVSAGKVVGRIKVLRSPVDIAKLKMGDIAAVKALDSCWNALYLIASGVLTEVGGIMSHAAIMVREQQIPAIFNISNLFEVVEDNDEVEIDCEKGVYTILSRGIAEIVELPICTVVQ
jgi:pyruvate,water dikinase